MGESFLYDVSYSDGEARLWFKGLNGAVRAEKLRFYNYLLVKREQVAGLELPVYDAEEVELKLFPRGSSTFFKLYFDSVEEYRRARSALERLGVETYASDIPVAHKVLAERRVTPMTVQGAPDSVEPLPLRVMRFSLSRLEGGKLHLSVHAEEGFSVQGPLEELVEALASEVRRFDPDLVASSLSYAELRRLAAQARRMGLKLGRGDGLLEGRIFVEYSLLARIGLAGLEERSRFTVLPPAQAARVSYGRMIDMRQSYVLLTRGYAVPRRMNLNVPVRTAWEIHLYDRGGLIIRPRPGLYRGVAVLDFESMFPNLIVKRNISYETVTRRGVRRSPRGLLPELIEEALSRRLCFKRLAKLSAGELARWAEERQSELKMILVSSYGYSGNNYNRLGNPLTFEWINRASRRVMLQVLGLVQRRGYRVVYGDTDSVFLTKPDAEPEDYERLALELSERTGLPMRLDAYYEWLFLLPERGGAAGVAKRYIGFAGGRVVAKGVEAVRSGVPEFIKRAQLELARAIVEAAQRGGDLEARAELELGRLASSLRRARAEELVAGATLRREEYAARTPVFVAAQQLRANGYSVTVGDYVEYVWVDSRNPNPYLRVQAWRLYDGRCLDMAKYEEMLARALAPLLESAKVASARIPGNA
ncbi:DNA polymerase domain-containing protein [Infirmifilum sp. SLHALR2]|nr:MAG: hypothetical protein B7L53_01320 [Thermofilum sp. NZ13]